MRCKIIDVCENQSPFTLLWLLGLGAALHASQGHPDLPKIYIYIYIYTKLPYFDHLNKNIDHHNLRITRISIQ